MEKNLNDKLLNLLEEQGRTLVDIEKVRRTYDFAYRKHKGQYRVGGEPYITHPIRVAEILRERGYGIDYQMVGLCHDLLEDTDATEQEIEAHSLYFYYWQLL